MDLPLEELSLRQLLESIAAKTPAPGGGAVSAITGALGAALAQMVLNYSVGRKSLAPHEAANREALHQLHAISQTMLDLARADAEAYQAMNELWKLDAADERRVRELPKAVANAIEPPRRMLEQSMAMLHLLQGLTGKTNAHLNSDLAIAAILAEAAARAAAWNVAINLPMLADATQQKSLQGFIDVKINEARAIATAVEQACQQAK